MNILPLLKKAQKHEKPISLTRMLYLPWGQILLQWLLKKAHCPRLKLIVQMFSFFTVMLLKLEFHVTFMSVAAYSMWILYVLLIEWVSVYLSLSFFFFCLFPFSSDLGQSIFYTTTCLLPFLSDDILSTLPYTMISTLATFPPFLHKDVIEYLSTSFLPMAICEYDPSEDHLDNFPSVTMTLYLCGGIFTDLWRVLWLSLSLFLLLDHL